MKIAIIGAMDEEVAFLAGALAGQVHETIAGHEFYLGTLRGHEVIVAKRGIGKACAACVATLLIVRYGATHIINTGCAGAIGAGLKPGATVFSTALAYHDVDMTDWGYKVGEFPGYPQLYAASSELISMANQAAARLPRPIPVYDGLIVSGDQFIASDAKKAEILRHFPDALMCEMEGAAVAQICTEFKIPFLVIRSASDCADDNPDTATNKHLSLACENSVSLVLGLLDEMEH